MTTLETKYKVQSLERGLTILRELRAANAPVRNQDLVSRTGLPKATVSRLLSTLGALGYVRRIDQGSYVLASASTRSGRAMLGALGLDRHGSLFAGASGTVYLEALVGQDWVPVYRWSQKTAGTVLNGAGLSLAPQCRANDCGDGDRWDAVSGTLWVWTHLYIDGVGSFALVLQDARESAPYSDQVTAARFMLQQAAKVMACVKE